MARAWVQKLPDVVLAFARKLGIRPSIIFFALAAGPAGVAFDAGTAGVCLAPVAAATEPVPAAALPCFCCWAELDA